MLPYGDLRRRCRPRTAAYFCGTRYPKKHDVSVDRFNLNSAPMEFVTNQTINAYINEKGVEGLPAVMVDGEIVITGRYPTSEEFMKLLDLPEGILTPRSKTLNAKTTRKKENGCGCKGGCC